jgi:hypothetical protein
MKLFTRRKDSIKLPKDALYRLLSEERQPLTESSEGIVSPEPLPRTWIAALFNRLRSIYGSRLEQAYGTVDSEDLVMIWSQTLAPYSGADLKMALEGVGDSYPEYPPTLPQFRMLCRDAHNRNFRAQSRLTDERRPEMPQYIRDQVAELQRKWNVTPGQR